MQFKKSSESIDKWIANKGKTLVSGRSPLRYLAESNGLTTQAIYNYVELVRAGKRDIRVACGDHSIWEVKRLGR